MEQDMDNNPIEEQFEIEKIIRRRVNRGGTVQYLVKWEGFDCTENSWVDEKDMTNCQELLDQFLVHDIIGEY